MIQEEGYAFDERGQLNSNNLNKNGGKCRVLIDNDLTTTTTTKNIDITIFRIRIRTKTQGVSNSNYNNL
jgi:hypothetical protein